MALVPGTVEEFDVRAFRARIAQELSVALSAVVVTLRPASVEVETQVTSASSDKADEIMSTFTQLGDDLEMATDFFGVAIEELGPPVLTTQLAPAPPWPSPPAATAAAWPPSQPDSIGDAIEGQQTEKSSGLPVIYIVVPCAVVLCLLATGLAYTVMLLRTKTRHVIEIEDGRKKDLERVQAITEQRTQTLMRSLLAIKRQNSMVRKGRKPPSYKMTSGEVTASGGDSPRSFVTQYGSQPAWLAQMESAVEAQEQTEVDSELTIDQIEAQITAAAQTPASETLRQARVSMDLGPLSLSGTPSREASEKGSPRGSPRASPRSSPRSSPRRASTSPRLSKHPAPSAFSGSASTSFLEQAI